VFLSKTKVKESRGGGGGHGSQDARCYALCLSANHQVIWASRLLEPWSNVCLALLRVRQVAKFEGRVPTITLTSDTNCKFGEFPKQLQFQWFAGRTCRTHYGKVHQRKGCIEQSGSIPNTKFPLSGVNYPPAIDVGQYADSIGNQKSLASRLFTGALLGTNDWLVGLSIQIGW
jgi:hypothetical protein